MLKNPSLQIIEINTERPGGVVIRWFVFTDKSNSPIKLRVTGIHNFASHASHYFVFAGWKRLLCCSESSGSHCLCYRDWSHLCPAGLVRKTRTGMISMLKVLTYTKRRDGSRDNNIAQLLHLARNSAFNYLTTYCYITKFSLFSATQQ